MHDHLRLLKIKCSIVLFPKEIDGVMYIPPPNYGALVPWKFRNIGNQTTASAGSF